MYAIEDGQLVLGEMAVGKGETLPINGVLPVLDTRPHSYFAVYRGLHLPVAFTGGILAGKDFVRALYVHMGFQKPHTFETLLEFRFEEGKVISLTDHSPRMAAIRQKMTDEHQRWEAAHRAELEEVERLREQLDALMKKIPVPRPLVDNDEPGSDLPEDEIEAIRQAIQAEMQPLRDKLQPLYAILYPPSKDKDTEVRQWIEESFSLNYRI